MTLRHALVAALLAGAVSHPATARDPRITTRLFNADEVVRVDGQAGVQATIAFGDDEHIENVAIGDSNGWQVTPNKRANLLFVKPLGMRARTNLTVVTDQHTYYFDLVAGNSPAPVYALRFTYPAEPKRIAKPADGITAEEAIAAQEPPKEVPPVAAPERNYAWRSRGSSRLLPTQVYDDGSATYITWNAANSVPAILTRNEKGEEGPVNYAVRGDSIIIDRVPKLFVLRSGKEVATLENRGKERPAPQAPASGPLSATAMTAASTRSEGL